MKDILKARGEEGFVLVLSLVIMAAMSVMAITVFTTSTTDMYIARNEKEAKIAFYLAEAGLAEAMGRMDLGGGNGRFAGEDSSDKTARRNAAPPVTPAHGDVTYTGNAFDSSDLGALSTFGSYSVTLAYAAEADDTWCDADDCTNGEIVMYGEDFGFSGTGVPVTGFNPIYVIESIGRTRNGTEATVRSYVTASSLNVLPPGSTILFTEGAITIGGAGKIDGKVASYEDYDEGSSVFDCISVAGFNCQNVSSTDAYVPSWNVSDMDNYLGYDMSTLASLADVLEVQSGNNAVTYNPPPLESDDGNWGEVCSDLTDDALSEHICDNEAKLIVIQNTGTGASKIQGTVRGRGILVATGDLELAGGVVWEGMIYVMGTLRITGNLTVYGTIMVNGDENSSDDEDVYINGGLSVRGSQEVASSVGDAVGIPRVVRWVRR